MNPAATNKVTIDALVISIETWETPTGYRFWTADLGGLGESRLLKASGPGDKPTSKGAYVRVCGTLGIIGDDGFGVEHSTMQHHQDHAGNPIWKNPAAGA